MAWGRMAARDPEAWPRSGHARVVAHACLLRRHRLHCMSRLRRLRRPNRRRLCPAARTRGAADAWHAPPPRAARAPPCSSARALAASRGAGAPPARSACREPGSTTGSGPSPQRDHRRPPTGIAAAQHGQRSRLRRRGPRLRPPSFPASGGRERVPRRLRACVVARLWLFPVFGSHALTVERAE